MKKVVLSLAVVFTLGMVSCGNSNKDNEQVPDDVVIEEVNDTVVNVETPQGEIEAAAAEGAAAVENVGNAAAQSVQDVKNKSSQNVKDAKAKAEEAVNNAADKASDAIDNATQKVEDAAQSAADRMKDKVNKLKK